MNEMANSMESENKRFGTETSSFGTNGRINHNSQKFYDSRLYDEIQKEKQVDYIEQEIPSEFLNKVINKSSESMDELPDNSVHLMITSPPYNVTKEYDDDLTLSEYFKFDFPSMEGDV